jgi:hypothetical protein
MGEFTLRAEKMKNRLYLAFAGSFADTEVKETARLIIREAGKLEPGFDAINDIGSCRPMSPEVNAVLKETQQLLKKMGMRRVVRVIGDALIAGVLISRNAREIGYCAATARTVDEAEKLLER